MLYIWPCFTFFSFPLLYPYILNSIIPQASLPVPFRSGSTRHQLPRATVAIPIIAAILLVVHFNTITHPFTLADNRHYVFYVFRILLRHRSIKYLAVPIYFTCAWASIIALGGLPGDQEQATVSQSGGNKTTNNRTSHTTNPPPQTYPQQGNTASFVLVWLLATSLSLITAPLVEPRYFILPWLMWRLHIPNKPLPETAPASVEAPRNITRLLQKINAADHRLWLETAWFLAVNWATGYIFLYQGFEWKQEPGVMQRFMW